MIKNIIFDWSGTLSNDLPQVHEASSHTFRYFKIKPFSLKQFRKEFTLPYMEYYWRYKKDISKDECDKVFFEKFNILPSPKPFPVKSILKYLQKSKVLMLILSSHPKENIEKELDMYGYKQFFKRIYGGVHNKGDSIRAIIKKNQLKARETAFAGDMTHDIEAGKKAKVKTIAVTWGYQDRERLATANPDYIIDSITELKRIINLSSKK